MLRKSRRIVAAAAVIAVATSASAEAWKVVEREVSYSVHGTTGPELYASIGERGPKVGGLVSAIAHTTFKLTWRRDYQSRDGSCVLASARPSLVITYTLPEPSSKLSRQVRSGWESFIAGVREHERVHGAMIRDMVREIERVSVGLRVENDPSCRRIRQELTRRLAEISKEQRRKSREFDKVELGDGGKIQKLVLGLVNGQ